MANIKEQNLVNFIFENFEDVLFLGITDNIHKAVKKEFPSITLIEIADAWREAKRKKEGR